MLLIPKVRGLEVQPLEGKSLIPIFNGKQRVGHDSIYFHFGTDRALRKVSGNSCQRKEGNGNFNLDNDRTELNDLSEEYPQKVNRMSMEWFDIAENKDRLNEKLLKPVKS